MQEECYHSGMTKKTPTRQVGWRLPVDLVDKLTAYAEQTQRSAVGAAIYLLTQGLAAAERRGEYTPPDKAA
jgi:hypothetical protein